MFALSHPARGGNCQGDMRTETEAQKNAHALAPTRKHYKYNENVIQCVPGVETLNTALPGVDMEGTNTASC